ncbi:MerR family transcriptional regulator [Roseomonas mucosa]
MKYTIGTAAKATGKSKSTISRDIKEGKLSADKREDGSYSIDPSELIRVYQEEFNPNRSATPQENDTQHPISAFETGGLQSEVERLREQLQGVHTERDRERRQLTDQIDDLRRRLDQEGEERRKLTAILTDQRAKPSEPAPAPVVQSAPEPPKGIFRRLFG